MGVRGGGGGEWRGESDTVQNVCWIKYVCAVVSFKTLPCTKLTFDILHVS